MNTSTERGSESQACEPAAEDSFAAFVARRPIFDRRLRVYGYELLFRSGARASRVASDGGGVTHCEIETALLDLDVEGFVGDKPAFVNFTKELLLEGCQDALPRSAVIELSATIPPEDEVIDACRRLKQGGRRLALEDVTHRPELAPLTELADIIKIRLPGHALADRHRYVRSVAPYATLLAGEVETREDHSSAVELGFQYFQGWFFCHPGAATGQALGSSPLTHLRLIQAVSRPELDVDELEQVIREDASLTLRFIQFLGSAAFGWSGPFTSVRHGLVLLGGEQTRRWVGLMSLREIAKDRPQELLIQAAIRAKVCEDLGASIGLAHRASDLFFLGSLSLIDTMLDRSMDDVLAELPLGEELEAALLGRASPLRTVLDLVVAYERGNWERCDAHAGLLKLPDTALVTAYSDGVKWAHGVFTT